MKYQRVLYTNKFTSELKSKLRIVSFHKQRSLKSNVYYVKFASEADMEYADKACKGLRDVTLKHFQLYSSKAQYEHQMSMCSDQKTLTSSSIPSSLPPVSFLSQPTTLTLFPNYRSACITSPPASLQRSNEPRKERAMRVIDPIISSRESVVPTLTLQPSNLDEKQLIDNIQSCLSAMKTAQRAAEELYGLHKRRLVCCAALNYFFEVHSTAFYLKAATSAQVKNLLLAGLRLSWADLANDINEFRTDVGHQQLFVAQIASAKYILSKIDSATSIAMSSKLAYQLTKLSH